MKNGIFLAPSFRLTLEDSDIISTTWLRMNADLTLLLPQDAEPIAVNLTGSEP